MYDVQSVFVRSFISYQNHTSIHQRLDFITFVNTLLMTLRVHKQSIHGEHQEKVKSLRLSFDELINS
jgi:hypothetical protein